MGCCDSSPEKEKNKSVGKELTFDKKQDQNCKKLLFLGSGGSGKSTLFKQLRTIHGEGFLDKDRMGFKDHIYSQIIEQMKNMIECYEELREEVPEEFGHLKLSSDGEEAANYIDYIRNDMDVDETVAKNVEILWKEDAMKEIFENRAKLKLDDSSAYFFDEVGRIATRSYIPTDKVQFLIRFHFARICAQWQLYT